jgi:hypothetical protein
MVVYTHTSRNNMSDTASLTKAELLARIEEGWNELNAYLQTLTEKQLTTPTDAAGWAAKDHIIHLSVWQSGLIAVLEGGSRREAMGIDEATWASWNVDAINDVIYQRNKNLPAPEAVRTLNTTQQRLFALVQNLSQADLNRPFQSYQSDRHYEGSLTDRILMNTSHHFAEHVPWIAAIVGAG